jgi:hypothetical protein
VIPYVLVILLAVSATLTLILSVHLILRIYRQRARTAQIQALFTDKDDPGAREKLRHIYAGRGEEQAKRQTVLWQRAPTNRRAARELQRMLEADLHIIQETLERLTTIGGDAALLDQLRTDEEASRRELAKLSHLVGSA